MAVRGLLVSNLATYLRYALASVCFAASVACLALWWRSQTRWELLVLPDALTQSRHTTAVSSDGRLEVTAQSQEITAEHGLYSPNWRYEQSADAEFIQKWSEPYKYRDLFGKRRSGILFPLWYPALVSALAGVGVIGFRRQFSIRSALIAFAVVAALLAMPLTL